MKGLDRPNLTALYSYAQNLSFGFIRSQDSNKMDFTPILLINYFI